VYFSSTQDGFRCLWMRAVDGSKRPVGVASAVRHFHTQRLTLGQVSQTAFTISIGGKWLYFNAGEVRGNIWKAQLDGGLSSWH
jgi:hypothetical protein